MTGIPIQPLPPAADLPQPCYAKAGNTGTDLTPAPGVFFFADSPSPCRALGS